MVMNMNMSDEEAVEYLKQLHNEIAIYRDLKHSYQTEALIIAIQSLDKSIKNKPIKCSECIYERYAMGKYFCLFKYKLCIPDLFCKDGIKKRGDEHDNG